MLTLAANMSSRCQRFAAFAGCCSIHCHRQQHHDHHSSECHDCDPRHLPGVCRHQPRAAVQWRQPRSGRCHSGCSAVLRPSGQPHPRRRNIHHPEPGPRHVQHLPERCNLCPRQWSRDGHPRCAPSLLKKVSRSSWDSTSRCRPSSAPVSILVRLYALQLVPPISNQPSSAPYAAH